MAIDGSYTSWYDGAPTTGAGAASSYLYWYDGAPFTALTTEEPEVEALENGIGLTWVEFLDALNNYHVWGKVALPDPASYYHGFKDDRVQSWGTIRRGMSDRFGNYDSSTFSWSMNDKDLAARALLANPLTRYFPSTPITVRMIDDPSRRQLLTPRTMFKGVIDGYRPTPELTFDWSAIDPISKKFARQDGLKLPQRTITLADFPHANDPLVQHSAGTVQTVGAVGKAVPIIYGELSDREIVTVQVPLGGTLPINAALANPSNQYAQDEIGNGTLLGWVTARVAAVVGANESDCGVVKAATYQSVFARGVRVFWDHVDGADSYRIYWSDHGGWDPHRGVMYFTEVTPTYGRVTTHNNSTFDGIGARGMSALLQNASDGVDALAGTLTNVQKDIGKGLIKPIYVGDYTIGGTIYKGALICGHAVKSLLAGYLNDAAVDLTTSTDWLTPNNAAAWTAAGFFDPYTDINGRRYFIIYLKGTAGEVLAGTVAPSEGSPGITVNVQGIEDIGGGTGNLITDIHDQYKHFMNNWVLQSYQGFAWLNTPMFSDETDLEMIDEASFDAAKATAAVRIAGGYPGAWMLGADGELLTVRDAIARLNLSGDVDCYFNRKTQFAVSMEAENTAAINDADVLDDTQDIFVRSFQIEDRLNDHYNVIPYFYKRDWSGRTASGWVSEGTESDASSILNYRQTKRSPDIELWGQRNAIAAADIAQRRLRRMKNPPRYVKFKVGLQGLNYEIGDIIKVTHHEGIGATGWFNNPIRITRHEVDPDEYTVLIEGYDMSVLFGSAFILGDRSVLPAAWTSASVAQRQYGYLGNRTTQQFSDGAAAKRV